MKNEINNQIQIGQNLDDEIGQKNFLETTLGKTINLGVDIGIRALLPDFIEEQIIDLKNNLIENINKEIDDNYNKHTAIKHYKDTYNFIYKYGVNVTDTPGYKAALCKTIDNKKLQDRITILQLPLISSPAVFRYHMHYYILMPDKLPLNEDEQEFIFRHEVSHILHHDITLKFFLQIICLFYWWNPFCYMLKKRSSLLFELRVDSSVVSQGDEQIRQYIACLVKVSKYSVSGNSGLSMPSAIRFSLKMESDTFIRVCFLLENKKMKNKILTRLISLPLCIIYIFSFLFIFEGYYVNPGDIGYSQEVTSENTYLVKNKDNTYDVYFYGKHIDTASSLDYYPDDCKIYLSLKEAKKNEEN